MHGVGSFQPTEDEKCQGTQNREKESKHGLKEVELHSMGLVDSI